MIRQGLLKLASVTLLAAMANAGNSLNGMVRGPPLADNSTYGNIDQISTKHVQLSLRADFNTRQLSGWAKH